MSVSARAVLAALLSAVCALSYAAPTRSHSDARRGDAILGFSEPFHIVRVASAENGTVDKLLVQEGERVRAGQPLSVLDKSVHESLVAAAAAAKDARGELDTAKADVRLREHRLQLLTRLHNNEFASAEELIKAQAELEIAASQVRSAEERQLLRKLEYDKLVAQLALRTIRAPQDGVISAIHKRRGEYVGPNDPVLFSLVQLDPLAATFLVPRGVAQGLKPGQKVIVQFLELKQSVPGAIEFVSPVIEASSGTVTVRVRVANEKGALRAGEPCQLLTSEPPSGSKP